jgi:hypothetical protein
MAAIGQGRMERRNLQMTLKEIFSGPQTQAKWKALGEFLQNGLVESGPGISLRRIGGKIIVSARKQRHYSANTLPPLWPEFGEDTDGEYAIISEGYVIDRSTKIGEALILYLPPEMTDENGDPKKFPIKSGQAVYVVVKVDEKGAITGDSNPVSILIDEPGKESTHYAPKIGDATSGTPGTYYYKLAEYYGKETDPKIFLGGSHIDHFRELPTFKKKGGTHDIFSKFDQDSGEYLTRGISADKPSFSLAEENIKITKTEDELKFKVIGRNLNLRVFEVSENSDGDIEIKNDPKDILCWRNAVYCGKFGGTDTLPGVEDGGKIDVCDVTRFTGSLGSVYP